MNIYPPRTYTEIIRVEIRNLKTREMRSVSFCYTTLEEVIKHVNSTLKVCYSGMRVRVNIRKSDKVKRWTDQKNRTVYIKDLDKALAQITEGISVLEWKDHINTNKQITE